MPVNLSAISTATTTSTALSNLILVSPQSVIGYQPQPKNKGASTPPKILFNYEGEQTMSIESDITDHFIEDNTAVNDQIALRPELITTHGFIGELNDVPPDELAPLKLIADKLTTVSAYTPALSAAAILAYNQAQFLYSNASNAKNSAVSAWNSINGNGNRNQTKQQIAFQQFYGYWRDRTLFTVQTPWGVFKDMAIKSLRAVQDAETRVITDFEVQFKILRFAQTSLTNGIALAGQSRYNNQASTLLNNGVSNPPDAPLSLGGGITGIA